jgi:hypothetical protein
MKGSASTLGALRGTNSLIGFHPGEARSWKSGRFNDRATAEAIGSAKSIIALMLAPRELRRRRR